MKELIEALRYLMSHSHNGFPQEKKDVINDFIARMDALQDGLNPCTSYYDYEDKYGHTLEDDENTIYSEQNATTVGWSKYCSRFIKAVTGAD